MKIASKTATSPSLRVEPQLREDTESVLQESESLSQFMEHAIRQQVELRQANAEFLARGLASRDKARQTGEYVDADHVLEKLQHRLKRHKAKHSTQ